MKNKVALITGATGGIGGAIAQSLYLSGFNIALIGRDLKKLEKMREELIKQKEVTCCCEKIACYDIDITNQDDVDRLVKSFLIDFNQLDVLVHSAGIFRFGSLEQNKVEILDELYNVNTRAPYLLTQKFLPLLQKTLGQIVFINSSSGLQTCANCGAYSASKAALKMLADSLRCEVNTQGIRVVSIFPGRTASVMQEAIHKLENKVYKAENLLQPSDVASVILNALLLPRTAEVTDVTIRPMIKS